MDHLKRTKKSIRQLTFIALLLCQFLMFAVWLVATDFIKLDQYQSLAAAAFSGLVIAFIFSKIITNRSIEPTQALWQAILHVAPNTASNLPAPNVDKLHVGRELVASLTAQVYQFAATSQTAKLSAPEYNSPISHTLQLLPVPVFIIKNDNTIAEVNEASLKYLGKNNNEVIGKTIYDVLNLSFPSENTYESWLNSARETKVLDNTSWARVRLDTGLGGAVKQFDLAASYTKDSSNDIETTLVIFDHSDRYNHDDQEVSFVAMAVHELRTPLTILRGYIEVFEDELSTKLDPEQVDFMHKMNASAQQLTSFVSNILNVARVEENQLTLQLVEADWNELIHTTCNDLSLRAGVHKKSIVLDIAPDLPKVAVDRISIYEVLNNLVDNAIKYGGQSDKILIKAIEKDGMIETTVTDYGLGIPSSVIGNLFDKFYRNHRNRSQIGGTGLGLYLSKAIVNAHGGQIWVQSKENEGSTFGFTIQFFSSIADELKNSDNQTGITRGAHGWIKNHSLYRR